MSSRKITNLAGVERIDLAHQVNLYAGPGRKQQFKLVKSGQRIDVVSLHQIENEVHGLPFICNPGLEISDVSVRGAVLVDTDLGENIWVSPDLRAVRRELRVENDVGNLGKIEPEGVRNWREIRFQDGGMNLDRLQF